MLSISAAGWRTNVSYSWHVGEPKFLDIAGVADTFMIQADGDELEYIRQNCKGIRDTGARVVRWIGDDAKFIASNLLMK